MANKEITGHNKTRDKRNAARQFDKRYERKRFDRDTVARQSAIRIDDRGPGDTVPGETETPTSTGFSFTTASDPAVNGATSVANVDAYDGVLITLSAAGNAQTMQSPTDTGAKRLFFVINLTASSDDIAINSITISPGEGLGFIWGGAAWEVFMQGKVGGVGGIGGDLWTESPAGTITQADTADKLVINQTSTTGYGLRVYRNLTLIGTDSPLMRVDNMSTTDDQRTMEISQGGVAEALYIYRSSNGANEPLVYIFQDSNIDNTPALRIRNDGEAALSLAEPGGVNDISFTVPSLAGDIDLTLPDTAPNKGERLARADTAGVLEFSRAGGLFGDGTLGNTTYSSNQTFTEDRHFRDLTISSSSAINLAGYRLFCTGTLTIGAGSSIHCNGNAGTNGSTPSAAAAGGTAISRTAEFGGSGAGGAGGTGTGGADTGGAAGSAELTTPSIFPGICLTGSGGGGGAETFPVEAAPGANGTAGSTGLATNGGAGGNSTPGSAGAGDIGCSGGGGGSGGGVCYIAARVISNSGTISANGGAGGNGVADAGIGISGNGGGGGGGSVLVYSTSATSGTVQANGGAAGTTGGGGGMAGSNGTVIWQRIG